MRTLVIAAVLAGTVATARADGQVELVGGGAIPVSDDDYTDLVDNSATFGLRFASAAAPGVGAEGGLEFTPVSLDNEQVLGVDASAWRLRALVGARGQWLVGGKGVVMMRIAAGADIAHYGLSGSPLGITVDESQTDVGLGIEAGMGLGVKLGKVVVGAQLALPIALHFDDDDPMDAHDFDFEYTAVDVEMLFGVAATM